MHKSYIENSYLKQLQNDTSTMIIKTFFWVFMRGVLDRNPVNVFKIQTLCVLSIIPGEGRNAFNSSKAS